ncbi:MAG: thrombospondin type 3 repeat-containing protein [Myxococcota bacterium]|nr:thrombospondin type 3 repeat-containing protein [Myxococcota bacterium]
MGSHGNRLAPLAAAVLFVALVPPASSGPAGPGIRMEPDLPLDFLSLPWPNDIRVRADGTIDLTGYPGTAVNILAAGVFFNGGLVTTGFGTNAAIYFQATEALDLAPRWDAAATLSDDAPALLVSLDAPESPRTPLLLDFEAAPTLMRPANLLSLMPYPGYALEQGTRYAAILFEDLPGAGRPPLARADLLDALDEPWDASRPVGEADWNALREQRDAAFAYVAAHTDRVPEEIVAFTVFTTQDLTSEMQAIAAAVAALPAPAPVSRSAGSCAPLSGTTTTVFGSLDLPRWQTGVPPYELPGAGGAIVVAGGVAVQQATERVDFEATFPCGPPPPEGWPILLWMAGTGGFAESDGLGVFDSAPLPYVVASIAPLYSGDRRVTAANPFLQEPEAQFFNFLNPLAARTNLLQQAADMIYLRRVVEGLAFSAAEAGAEAPVETDDALVVIAGHSQGALTIPITIGVDDRFDAAFLSAGGAGLFHALAHRGSIRETLATLVPQLEPDELDRFHPLVTGLQTISEIGDPANYAPFARSAHVLSVGGLRDGCSPWEAISHLGTALGLPLANTTYHPTFGSLALEPIPDPSTPLAGNLPDGRTGVTVQLDHNHFGAYENPALGSSFVRSLPIDLVPAVDVASLSSGDASQCARADALPPLPDSDGDGVPDFRDNCLALANPDQRDANRDGYGNACDADYDDDGLVGIADFNRLRSRFGSTDADPGFDPEVDVDGDGAVGIVDFNRLRGSFGEPPGPSGLACAGSAPCPPI